MTLKKRTEIFGHQT